MIVSRIRCGLGNQMFQYATGYALAQRAGLPFRVDTSWYRSPEADRDLYLGDWAIAADEVDGLMPPPVVETRKLFHKPLVQEPSELIGYWQTEKYFLDARADLLLLFRPRAPAPVSEPFDVGIHVRRLKPFGDRFVDIATEDYYAKAIAAFRDDMIDPTFSVWSDQPTWTARHFPPDFTIQPTGHPVHDLYAMSRCNHQIIANSSYSWWAAWLNQNPDKRIVWPDRLTHTYPPVAETDYIPDSWQQP